MKEKVIKFINLLTENKFSDNISEENYSFIKYLIKLGMIKFNNFKSLLLQSKNIVDKMNYNFYCFSNDFFNFKEKTDVDYGRIRTELFNIPTFNKADANELVSEISQIKFRFLYELKFEKFSINLFFYDKVRDEKLYLSLAKIVYLFVKTFDNGSFLNYNIRFLLIDFPRKLDQKISKSKNDFKLLSNKGFYNNSSGINNHNRKELVVTRKSGINGLLIHELIHMLGLDFGYDLYSKTITNIENWETDWINENNILKTNNNIESFVEGICNSNTSYYLSIYNAIILNSKLKTDKINKYFKYFLYIEFIYSYINCVRLFNYFEKEYYNDIFNDSKNRFYYQNAYVFEYVVLRMFIISDYYNLLFKKMLKYNFNKLNKKNDNKNLQIELNKNLLKIVKTKKLEYDFNFISNILLKYYDNNYIEYFATNLNI